MCFSACATDLQYSFLYKIYISLLDNFTLRFKPFSLTRNGFLCYIYNVHDYLGVDCALWREKPGFKSD